MRIDEVLAYCGNVYQIHKQFGFSQNTPKNWKIRGYIPIVTQVRIEHLTNGALKADLSHCNKVEDDPISE